MSFSISSLVPVIEWGATGALCTSSGATLYAAGRALWVAHKNEGEFKALRHMGFVSLGTVPSMVMIGCYMGRSGMSRLPASLYGVLGAFGTWSGVTGCLFFIASMPTLSLHSTKELDGAVDRLNAVLDQVDSPGVLIPEHQAISPEKRQLLDDLEKVLGRGALALLAFAASFGVIYCFSNE